MFPLFFAYPLSSTEDLSLPFNAPFADTTSHLLTSATDRAIRLLTVSPISGDLKPSHKFQDSVNRTPWFAIGFNPDSEYVMGGAGHKAAHTIFIWDRESGVLVKVLEEPKESLGDCEVNLDKPNEG